MGETFHQPIYAELQPNHHPFPASHTAPFPPHDVAIKENGEEETYTIKCICGFDDDDGNTVLCEKCNTWQHVVCYYGEDAKDLDLETFNHECSDCHPRMNLDAVWAAHYQKTSRHLQVAVDDRKSKKTGSKNHKKNKTKDLQNGAHQVNGWSSHDSHFASPSTGSPRDSVPPAKRPKTNHRTSGSLSNGNGRQVNGRHRSVSNAIGSVPQPNPPLEQCPPDFLSPEFIRVHKENAHFSPASANMFLDITVTTLLGNWLDYPEEFAKVTNGKSHSDVFKQFPYPIEELELPILKNVHKAPHVRFHDSTPQWPYLTVDQDVVAEQFVGELRGSIGRREDYQNDTANQWGKLRHPNHFVFFHPLLPIYIDARQEGTILRYARRSCRPNLKMETIITGERDYRFCFTALTDIPRGTEITIGWDMRYDPLLQTMLNKSLAGMSLDDRAYVSDWVGTNLAHFGGCACENQYSAGTCLLATFDRRATKDLPDGTTAAGKPRKKRGPKKVPAVTSHGTNSRESSAELLSVNHGADLEMTDDRSTTRSSRSSRDTTPSISEREKRKILQTQKLFDQMEHDKQQPAAKRKKRGSVSNVQTPVLAIEGKLNHPGRPLSHPSTPFANAKTPIGLSQEPQSARSPSSPNVGKTVTMAQSATSPKPTYVDAATQTPSESEVNASVVPSPRPQFLPPSKQLLKRSLLQSQLRKRKSQHNHLYTPKSSSAGSPSDSQPMDTESSNSGTPIPPHHEAVKAVSEAEDIEMGEAQIAAGPVPGDVPMVSQQPPPEDKPPTLPVSEEPSLTTHPPIMPPPPPWTIPSPKKEETMNTIPNITPTAPTHIDLAPESLAPVPNPVVSPQSAEHGTQQASPSSAALPPTSVISPPSTSLRTPAEANSITKPSPIKKKMSLSDYMSKRRQETPAVDKTPTPGPLSAGLSSGNSIQAKDETAATGEKKG